MSSPPIGERGNKQSPLSLWERVRVRGLVENETALTPSLSRRERGHTASKHKKYSAHTSFRTSNSDGN